MSAALTEDDLDGLIRMSISSTDAQGMQDMGRVMNHLRPDPDIGRGYPRSRGFCFWVPDDYSCAGQFFKLDNGQTIKLRGASALDASWCPVS